MPAILTMLFQGVMEAGANGYILKDNNALLRSLKNILAFVAANGGIYLSPQAKQLLLQRQAAGAELGLTPRQVEALALCVTYPESSNVRADRPHECGGLHLPQFVVAGLSAAGSRRSQGSR